MLGGADRKLDAEMIERLVNIEAKTDAVLRQQEELRHELHLGYRGNADQSFGHITYAQCGEDLILRSIFELLHIDRPSYLDVGAHHPLDVSNTALMYQIGSRGINVEANPNLVAAFHQMRPEDITLNIGVGPTRGAMDFYFIDDWSGRNSFNRESAEAFVREDPRFRIQKVERIKVLTLNDIVDQHCGGVFPKFLSLDAEGLDFDILRTARFGDNGPDVICVEAISGDNQDDSKRLVEVMRHHGYVPHFRTLVNVLFLAQRHQAALAL